MTVFQQPSRRGNAIFISWSQFSRRTESMEDFFGLNVFYAPSRFHLKILKPFGYIFQCIATMRALATNRPKTVWVQCPPNFLPHLVLMLRPITGRCQIVADCHHSTFKPRWRWVPGTIWALNQCDVVLVHNAESRPIAEGYGIDSQRIMLLEDRPPVLRSATGGRRVAAPVIPYILVPCSFSPDEPIMLLLGVARLVPDVTFLITGSKRKAESLGFLRDVPPNVRFTDYLELEEFERLLADAAVVMGLTSEEGVQLSVANEALGADKALVLSDTRILREMFGAAALFAKNTPEDWAARLHEALARRAELEARSAALKTRRIEDWRAPAEAVARRLAS